MKTNESGKARPVDLAKKYADEARRHSRYAIMWAILSMVFVVGAIVLLVAE